MIFMLRESGERGIEKRSTMTMYSNYYNLYDNTPDEAQQLLQANPFFPANNAELRRRRLLQQILNEQIGGVLPPSLDLSRVHRVLDVQCGSGEWIVELARLYPSMEIIGIDHRAYFIEHARNSMHSAGNVTFQLQDRVLPDQRLFAPGSFDLIHLQLLATRLTPRAFPALMHALARFSRPGGLIVWCEAELPITNSLACERMTGIILEGLTIMGQKFCPGHSLGITAHLRHRIANAGYSILHDQPYVIEVSAHTDIHKAFCQQVRLFGKQVQPFLFKTGVTTKKAFEEIYAKAMQEIREESFCGLCFLRCVVGVKGS